MVLGQEFQTPTATRPRSLASTKIALTRAIRDLTEMRRTAAQAFEITDGTEWTQALIESEEVAQTVLDKSQQLASHRKNLYDAIATYEWERSELDTFEAEDVNGEYGLEDWIQRKNLDTEYDKASSCLNWLTRAVNMTQTAITTFMSVQQLARAVNRQNPRQGGNNENPPEDRIVVQPVVMAQNTPRLPEITLPIFSGEPDEYPAWLQIFKQLVGNNQNLNDLDKFTYLLSCLKGRAESVLKSVTLSAENYALALTLLEEKYANAATQQLCLLQKLRNTPKAHNTEETSVVHDRVNAIYKQLVKEKIEMDPLTRQDVLQKFPKDIEKKVRRVEITHDNWDNKTFMEQLQKAVTEMERLSLVTGKNTTIEDTTLSSSQAPDSPFERRPRDSRQRKPHFASKYPSRSPSGSRRQPFCVFCKLESHWSNDCQRVKGVEERRKFLIDEKRCFRCLRSFIAGEAHQCNARPCKCKSDRHHFSICPLDPKKDQPAKRRQPGKNRRGRNDRKPSEQSRKKSDSQTFAVSESGQESEGQHPEEASSEESEEESSTEAETVTTDSDSDNATVLTAHTFFTSDSTTDEQPIVQSQDPTEQQMEDEPNETTTVLNSSPSPPLEVTSHGPEPAAHRLAIASSLFIKPNSPPKRRGRPVIYPTNGETPEARKRARIYEANTRYRTKKQSRQQMQKKAVQDALGKCDELLANSTTDNPDHDHLSQLRTTLREFLELQKTKAAKRNTYIPSRKGQATSQEDKIARRTESNKSAQAAWRQRQREQEDAYGKLLELAIPTLFRIETSPAESIEIAGLLLDLSSGLKAKRKQYKLNTDTEQTQIERPSEDVTSDENSDPDKENMPPTSQTFHTMGQIKRTFTMTGIVTLRKRHKAIRVHAIFDSASQFTFINRKLMKQLEPKILGTSAIRVEGIGGNVTETEMPIVELILDRPNNRTPIRLQAFVMDRLTQGFVTPKLSQEDKDYFEATGINPKLLPACGGRIQPDILFGNDSIWEIFNFQKKVDRLPSGLAAIHTLLGVFIGGHQGKLHSSRLTQQAGTYPVTATHDDFEPFNADSDSTTRAKDNGLEETLKKFWDLDSMGIRENRDTSLEQKIICDIKSSIQRRPDGLYVGFPWIEPEAKEKLASNRQQSISRLEKLIATLKEKDLLTAYHNDLMTQEALGFIEAVPAHEWNQETSSYIAHRAVMKPSSETTKLRIVFDCSARSRNSPSLNSIMYKGPISSLMPDLVGLLMKARSYENLLTADVSKAFHALKILEEDRDKFRFLWLKDIRKPWSRDNLCEYRFRVVIFGARSSPLILAATIDAVLEQCHEPLAAEIRRLLYVDNLIMRAKNPRHAINKYKESKKLFRDQLFMDLRQYTCNLPRVMSQIPAGDKTGTNPANLLGLSWDIKQDLLTITFPKLTEEHFTKRGCASFLSQIFDPLGLVSPLILPLKRFLQDLWRNEVVSDWDEPLPREYADSFRALAENLQGKSISFTRKTIPDPDRPVRLAVFTDSSRYAYGCVAYLIQDGNGYLIYAKNRLAPKDKTKTQTMTIPRLEMIGLVNGCNMAQFIKNNLNHLCIDEIAIFSDSQIALNWATNGGDTKMSLAIHHLREKVQNLQKILGFQLYYIVSEENPADLNSRGTSSIEQLDEYPWKSGPIGALRQPLTFPKFEHNQEVQCMPTTVTPSNGPFLPIERFSRWARVIGAIKYVLLFLYMRIYLRVTGDSRKILKKCLPEIAKKPTLKDAELCLLKDRQLGLSDALKQKHDLFRAADGLWRVNGRLGKTAWPFDRKHPIFLDKADPALRLIIQQLHESNGHVGSSHTTASIRDRFDAPHLKRAVRVTLSKCMACKKQQKHLLPRIRAPDLPEFRVTQQFPFKSTAVDYLGPFQVIIQGMQAKAYVCVFQCLVTRLVAFEIAEDLSALTFFHLMRRFTSRRGVPETFLSDNGTNFVAVSNFLKAMKVKNFVEKHQITWIHTTPATSRRGGVFERSMGLIKSSWRKIIGTRTLDLMEFTTTMFEIEAILNSRPITFVHGESQNIVLRPRDFIYPGIDLQLHPHLEPESQNKDVASQTELQNFWENNNKILDAVWTEWQTGYLDELRRQHNNPSQHTESKLREGDIVLMKVDNKPRNQWPLAEVIGRVTSSDELCRTVRLRTANGKTFTRATDFVVPLEISTVPENPKEDQTTKETSPSEQPERGRKQGKKQASLSKALPSDHTTKNARLGSSPETTRAESNTQKQERKKKKKKDKKKTKKSKKDKKEKQAKQQQAVSHYNFRSRPATPAAATPSSKKPSHRTKRVRFQSIPSFITLMAATLLFPVTSSLPVTTPGFPSLAKTGSPLSNEKIFKNCQTYETLPSKYGPKCDSGDCGYQFTAKFELSNSPPSTCFLLPDSERQLKAVRLDLEDPSYICHENDIYVTKPIDVLAFTQDICINGSSCNLRECTSNNHGIRYLYQATKLPLRSNCYARKKKNEQECTQKQACIFTTEIPDPNPENNNVPVLVRECKSWRANFTVRLRKLFHNESSSEELLRFTDPGYVRFHQGFLSVAPRQSLAIPIQILRSRYGISYLNRTVEEEIAIECDSADNLEKTACKLRATRHCTLGHGNRTSFNCRPNQLRKVLAQQQLPIATPYGRLSVDWRYLPGTVVLKPPTMKNFIASIQLDLKEPDLIRVCNLTLAQPDLNANLSMDFWNECTEKTVNKYATRLCGHPHLLLNCTPLSLEAPKLPTGGPQAPCQLHCASKRRVIHNATVRVTYEQPNFMKTMGKTILNPLGMTLKAGKPLKPIYTLVDDPADSGTETTPIVVKPEISVQPNPWLLSLLGLDYQVIADSIRTIFRWSLWVLISALALFVLVKCGPALCPPLIAGTRIALRLTLSTCLLVPSAIRVLHEQWVSHRHQSAPGQSIEAPPIQASSPTTTRPPTSYLPDLPLVSLHDH